MFFFLYSNPKINFNIWILFLKKIFLKRQRDKCHTQFYLLKPLKVLSKTFQTFKTLLALCNYESCDFIPTLLSEWINKIYIYWLEHTQLGFKNLVLRRTGSSERGERRSERLDICYGHSNTITNPKRAPFITELWNNKPYN